MLNPRSDGAIERPRRFSLMGGVLGMAMTRVGLVFGRPFTTYNCPAPTSASKGLSVEPSASSLVIGYRGDAEADRLHENRSLRHSVLEPTGRYVEAGERIRITLPGDASGMDFGIGQYGPYARLNGGGDVGVKRTPLRPGVNHLVSDRSGLVWLIATNASPVCVTVRGGRPVPTFTLGNTDWTDFTQQLEQFDQSPFVLIQGERVLAAFQRCTVTKNLALFNEERVQHWDQVVELTDKTYGLSTGERGLHGKSAGRIFISNPDTGPAYASATHDRVTFHAASGAGADLLRKPIKEQWGLWHEIGHTYQAPQMTWRGLGEVTVNISPLAVQAAFGWEHELLRSRHAAAIRAYLSRPVFWRDFDEETDPFVKLGLFATLQHKLGEKFFPAVHRRYRERAAIGRGPVDDEDKRQFFMTVASEIAHRNLVDHFIKWGLSPSPETREAMAAYPAL